MNKIVNNIDNKINANNTFTANFITISVNVYDYFHQRFGETEVTKQPNA